MNTSRVLKALLVLGLLLAVGAAGGAWWFYDAFLRDLPDLRRIEDYEPARSSIVYDRQGRAIGEFYEERRRLVPIDQIPRHVQLAFVAAEDGSFFEHEGLDYRGIVRAALSNLLSGDAKGQGASTITQQMVKSLLLSPEKTYRRKIREMFLARDIEKRFTKDEILYLYLNQIYFGQGAWGIEEAARTYFGKSVNEIGISEAALLAGLPQRPSEYSPYRNPESAERRRRYVLGRMRDDEIIDESTYATALADLPELERAPEVENFGPATHFTELVRRYLYERLGGDVVLEGGLRIETTLDLDLQLAGVDAVRRGLEAHDHRQGWRGAIRTAKPGEIDAAIAEAAEANAELFVGLLPEDLGFDLEPGDAPVVEDGEARPADGEAQGQAGPAEAGELAATEAPVSDEGPADAAADGDETVAATAPLLPPEPDPIAFDVPFDEPLLGVVVEVDRASGMAKVALGRGLVGTLALPDVDWAREPNPQRRPLAVRRIDWIVKVGDVAEVVRLPDLTPEEIEEDERAEPELRPIYDPSLDAETLAALEAEGALPEPIAELPVARLDLHQVPKVQGSLLSMDIESGDVLALVGGYDHEASEFNRATQAKRQPGSAFKPFIYGAALTKGYTPVSEVVDRPVVYTDPVSGFVWAPRNYGRRFYGPMPMRNALKKSVNNATVHLFREVGVDYVIDYARRLGIQSPLSRDLSLALGSSAVTLLELTTAYAVFPNHGHRVLPRFITKVSAADGTVLLEDVPLGPPPPPVLRPLAAGFEVEGEAERAAESSRTTSIDDLEIYPDAEIMPTDEIISEAEAYLMCDLLRAVVQEGTGQRLKRLGRPLAGKTGTTNEQGDAWFMGFSPEIVTGVWVGNDDNTVLGWGETGAGAALPIWGDYMKVALDGKSIRDFDVPEGDPEAPETNIVFERIDRDTGLIADAGTQNAYFQPFISGTQPDRTVSDRTTASDAEEALREDLF